MYGQAEPESASKGEEDGSMEDEGDLDDLGDTEAGPSIPLLRRNDREEK
jgi:hypothetical protein